MVLLEAAEAVTIEWWRYCGCGPGREESGGGSVAEQCLQEPLGPYVGVGVDSTTVVVPGWGSFCSWVHGGHMGIGAEAAVEGQLVQNLGAKLPEDAEDAGRACGRCHGPRCLAVCISRGEVERSRHSLQGQLAEEI